MSAPTAPLPALAPAPGNDEITAAVEAATAEIAALRQAVTAARMRRGDLIELAMAEGRAASTEYELARLVKAVEDAAAMRSFRAAFAAFDAPPVVAEVPVPARKRKQARWRRDGQPPLIGVVRGFAPAGLAARLLPAHHAAAVAAGLVAARHGGIIPG